MIVQVFLVISFLLFSFYFINNFNKVRVKAWKRIAFSLFILFGIISVLHPELVDFFAKKMGIGRGADLLLYTSVITFLFVTINFYIKFKELSLKIDKTISKLTQLEGDQRDGRN